MVGAFNYVKDNALNTEDEYPYKGKNGVCNAKKSGLTISSYHLVHPKDPQALKNAVSKQPVSVAIEADKSVFQNYKSGIIDSSRCGTSTDHGVLVIGYGNEGGEDYWLLKNSWGVTWGEKGYFKILREMNKTGLGICALQESPSYPTA